MLRVTAVAGVIAVLAGCTDAEIGDPPGGGDGGGGAPDGSAVPDAAPGTPDAPPVADAAPPADAPPCVEGDLNVIDPATGNCYMFFSAEVPWNVALGACGALAGTAYLATPTSDAENAVIAGIPAAVADAWMGGTDATTEMMWVWSNGEPFVYDNWRSGEPNNGGETGEDCMIMEIDNGGTWDDRPCNLAYPYLCERE
jgi:hypothetical protein